MDLQGCVLGLLGEVGPLGATLDKSAEYSVCLFSLVCGNIADACFAKNGKSGWLTCFIGMACSFPCSFSVRSIYK